MRKVYPSASTILSCRSASMKGIYTTSVCAETIDESPMAYKPMQEIIECIQPTVEIMSLIKPVYNFKVKG